MLIFSLLESNKGLNLKTKNIFRQKLHLHRESEDNFEVEAKRQ